VWVKKVEKDLQGGKSVREFTVQAEAEKHRERMVSGLLLGRVVACMPGGVRHIDRPRFTESCIGTTSSLRKPEQLEKTRMSHERPTATKTPLHHFHQPTLQSEIEKVQKRREEKEAEKERMEEELVGSALRNRVTE
jgi:hypothetical protein